MCVVFAFLDTPVTLLILGTLAVLLFGEQLPEVVQSIRKGVGDVAKEMRGIQKEIKDAVKSPASIEPSASRPESKDQEATVSKSEPP